MPFDLKWLHDEMAMRRLFVMAELRSESTFVCDECERHFDLRLVYIRDKKRFCPVCYRNEYGWEYSVVTDGFEAC